MRTFFYLCTLLSSFHSFSPLGILTYGPDPPVSGYLLSPPLQVELAKEEAKLAHTMAGRAPRRSRDPPISFSHEVCFSLLKHISLSHDKKISHGHAFFDWELRWCRFLTFLTGSRLCEDGCALFRLWTGRQQPWRGPGLPFSSASVRFSWSGELRRGYASTSSWSRNARTYLPAVAGQQGRRYSLTYSMATS